MILLFKQKGAKAPFCVFTFDLVAKGLCYKTAVKNCAGKN